MTTELIRLTQAEQEHIESIVSVKALYFLEEEIEKAGGKKLLGIFRTWGIANLLFREGKHGLPADGRSALLSACRKLEKLIGKARGEKSTLTV